jgi:hypothetical protein
MESIVSICRQSHCFDPSQKQYTEREKPAGAKDSKRAGLQQHTNSQQSEVMTTHSKTDV